jgi:predicted nucleic-acid-binding protein
MRAIDTNVLVRLLAADDPQQAEAARRWIQGGVWVSTLALAESIWVLEVVYHRGPNEIAATVETLLNHVDLALQAPEVVAAALEQVRKRPRVGFSDCLLLELARAAGHLPLGTFDRDLSKRNGAEKI